MSTYIKGKCLGVKVDSYTGRDPLITIIIEDDEKWHETDCQFSAYWLNDLISALEQTKTAVDFDAVVKNVQEAIASNE